MALKPLRPQDLGRKPRSASEVARLLGVIAHGVACGRIEPPRAETAIQACREALAAFEVAARIDRDAGLPAPHDPHEGDGQPHGAWERSL